MDQSVAIQLKSDAGLKFVGRGLRLIVNGPRKKDLVYCLYKNAIMDDRITQL